MTPVDFTYLDTMADGDVELRETMLAMLLEELPAEIDELRRAYATRDWDTLWKTAHKHKSTLAFVGQPDMLAAVRRIEVDAKEGHRPENLDEPLRILEKHQPAVLDAVRGELGA